MIKQYRKKPVTIEAMLFDGSVESAQRVLAWLNGNWPVASGKYCRVGDEIKIKTLEGVMTANAGDYIIKGVKGEFYPCKPDIFALTYDLDGE